MVPTKAAAVVCPAAMTATAEKPPVTKRRSLRVNSFMQSLLQKVSFYLCLCPINNEDKMIPSAAVTT